MKRFLGVTLVAGMLFMACSNKGKQIPPFEFTSLSGKTINSVDLKGKIVVLNVWATWCGTCISEIPDLNRLVNKYKDDDEVYFIALSDERQGKVIPVLQRFPFHYEHIVEVEDYTSQLQTRLVKTFPQNLILNQESTVVFDVSDGTGNLYQKMDAIIQDLKKGN